MKPVAPNDVTVFSNSNNVVCCHREESEVGALIWSPCGHVDRGDTRDIPDWLVEVLTGERPSERH